MTITEHKDAIEVFVFYGDILTNTNRDSFEIEFNGLLKGFYFWKPYPEEERRERVLDIIKKLPCNSHRLDLNTTSMLTNILEEKLLNIIDGKYEPYEIPKILPPNEKLDSYSNVFVKKISNDYIILAQQWPPDKKLSGDDARIVIAAIMNWFMEKKSKAGGNYHFYLFFHDKHIGFDKQYESDNIFTNPQKEDFISKIKALLKIDYKDRIAVEEIISFKHESNGKTFEILKGIHNVTDVNEIKKRFAFSKRNLTKILNQFLPIAIDCYGVNKINDTEIKYEYIKEAFGSKDLKDFKNKIALLKPKMETEMKSVDEDTSLSKEKRRSIRDKWARMFECEKYQDYAEKFRDFSNEIESLE
jgi:hypothetical protein